MSLCTTVKPVGGIEIIIIAEVCVRLSLVYTSKQKDIKSYSDTCKMYRCACGFIRKFVDACNNVINITLSVKETHFTAADEGTVFFNKYTEVQIMHTCKTKN